MANKREPRKELPIKEIVKEWEEGKTQRELAEEYGVSLRTINIRISEYYEQEGREKPIKEIPRKELPIKEIVKEWEEGKTQRELAEEYGVSLRTINIKIGEYYEQEGKEKPRKPRNQVLRKEIPIKEIVKEWEEGKTQRELAEEYGVSLRTINRRISEYYEQEGKEKPKKPKKTKKPRKEIPIEKIVKEWEEGKTQSDLAEEYGVSPQTINRRISEYYEQEGREKPRKPKKPRKEIPIEKIVKEWEEGKTQSDLAEEYGVSPHTINRRISEYYEQEGREKPRKPGRLRKELPIEAIVKEWEEGKTQSDLAEKYGELVSTINYRISEYYEQEGKDKPRKPRNQIPRKEIPIEVIAKEWEEGKTLSKLAEEYGVSLRTINRRISEYYEQEGKEKPRKPRNQILRKEIPIEVIAKEWEEGKTLSKLAEEYGVSLRTINRRISEYCKKTGMNFRVLKSSVIIMEYLEKGLTPEQIELIALKQNIIIPKDIMEKAVKKTSEKADGVKLKNQNELEGK